MLRSRHIALAALCVGAMGAAAMASPGTAYDPNDASQPMPARATYQANDVVVNEQLRALVPVDATFRTVEGLPVTLGAVLAGPIPTILTFNYSSCPQLCSLQLNGLVNSLRELDMKVGQQFRVVTVNLDPDETLAHASAMRERYLESIPAAQRDVARAGWTFLLARFPGDASQIRRVADAVGFTYKYLPERAEYAHPAALIFLSTRGTVTRYVYGIEFGKDLMHESIAKAGIAEPSTAAGFMNRCYHFDPSANDHSRSGVLALQIGGAVFILFLTTAGFFYLRRISVRREAYIP